jgi:class 3 adenylate cyclase
VREWRWADAFFAEGATILLGFLFFAVGIGTFVLRPYTQSSWAVVTLCTLTAGMLTTFLLPEIGTAPVMTLYFLSTVGLINFAPLHAGLVFPAPHWLLTRFPQIVWLIYLAGAVQSYVYCYGWIDGFHTSFAASRIQGAATLLASILFLVGRCAVCSFRAEDPLIAQRARILLAGSLLGLVPAGIIQLLQQGFQVLPLDTRFMYWSLGIFLFALARVTVHDEILNAAVAVRRAVMYAGAVGVLTAIAWALSAVTPYAVAALLLPLLYVWPRFDERLNQRLYPRRVEFPKILRAIGDDLAAAANVDEVLDKLAAAPTSLCDTARSVAFVLPHEGHDFPHDGHQRELIRVSDGTAIDGAGPIADEPLISMMRTTRQRIQRNHIAVQPQYAKIKDDCYRGFDRLGAQMLLPIVQAHQVIGGLAVGPRTTGEVYERPEIEALRSAAQQAVQAIVRVEATERLRERELEFADLKRFFTPQVIDQVMARGGASGLGSTRKQVTVFFADLRGFTSFSELVEPEEVMTTLAEYHEAMGRRIVEYGGTLERFAGDGFMVFFNDPVEQPDHADRAVGMAAAMLDDMEILRSEWNRQGYNIHVGMGIDTGYATCGFIGYEGRRDYGVIGNVTNLAARLSDAAGPGQVYLSTRARSELRNGARTESVGELVLKGFLQPQPVFRLVSNGHAGSPSTDSSD